MADNEEARRMLEDLQARLERIERHLQLEPLSRSGSPRPVQPTSAPASPPIVPPRLSADRQRESWTQQFRTFDSKPDDAAAHASALGASAAELQSSAARMMPSPVAPLATMPGLSPALPSPSMDDHSGGTLTSPLAGLSWEKIIGERWLAWVGSITVVIGAVFLAGYIDVASVWGALPALAKCLCLTSFGAALLIGGEVAMRRYGLAAAVGLYAAGLGTLYTTAFASFGWYGLLSETAALLLMGVVSVGGCGLTLRTKSLTIGTLSLLGAFIAPLLLRGAPVAPLAQPLYLTAIFAIGLALSAWPWRAAHALDSARDSDSDADLDIDAPATLSAPFGHLRGVAVGGLVVLATFWIIKSPGALWREFLVFGGIWWMMTTGEALLAAMRRQSPVANPAATLVMTAWYATAACWLLQSASPTVAAWQGAFATGMALLAAAIAFQFGPALEVLRGDVRTPIAKFSASLLVQAAVLLVVAAALQFDGYGQSISWLAIAVASIEVGRRMRSRAVDRFGLIVGALAIARIASYDAFLSPSLRAELLDLAVASINGWTLLALGAVAATVFAAHRICDDEGGTQDAIGGDEGMAAQPRRRTFRPHVLMALAVIMWAILCVVAIEPRYVTWGWLAAGAALLAFRSLGEPQRYFSLAQGAIFISAAKWLVFDTFVMRVSNDFPGSADPDAFMVLLNPQMLLGLALAAALWWLLRVQKERAMLAAADAFSARRGEAFDRGLQAPPAWQDFARSAWLWAPVVATIVILWGLSFEVDRLLLDVAALAAPDTLWTLRRLLPLSLCVLWSAGGFALFAAGISRGRRPLVYAGMTLVMLAAAAWLTIATFIVSVVDPARSAMPLMNPQFLSALILAGMLAGIAAGITGRNTAQSEVSSATRDAARDARFGALALIGLIGLWIGTIEIDRALAGSAMQAALSIFWAVYGIGLIAVGFWKRAAMVRYAGLALLGVTLIKVAMLDTAQLEGIYRPMSYIAVGLLFVAASIGYTRLSPRLLAGSQE